MIHIRETVLVCQKYPKQINSTYALNNQMADYDTVLRTMRGFGPVNLDQFNNRMYHQKLAYLIQQINCEKQYSFSWYVRGPYSPSLASSLFFHEAEGSFENEITLNKAEDVTKSRIIDLLDKKNDPYSLELYASVWYLMSGNKTSATEEEEILTIMYKEKPHFDRKTIKAALDRISRFRQKYSL